MIIHLLAPKDQTKWPKIWHNCYKSWEECPHKIKMWYDEDIDQLLKEDDEEFFNILNNLPSIYKFDYVRYIILERLGGAYFDMDVEIIDGSFLKKINPTKVYVMEGTLGSYIENSIIISPNKKDYILWQRFKFYCKAKVMNNISKCSSPEYVIEALGPIALSDFFIKYCTPELHGGNKIYEILPYQMFASLTNELALTRHYQTHHWNKNKI